MTQFKTIYYFANPYETKYPGWKVACEFEEALNEYSADGWELVSAHVGPGTDRFEDAGFEDPDIVQGIVFCAFMQKEVSAA